MMQKLELYIHIPFCVQKCAYCDFLSAPANDAVKAEYVDALKKEIQRYREVASSYQVSSVFVGGGTPSILSFSIPLIKSGSFLNDQTVCRNVFGI